MCLGRLTREFACLLGRNVAFPGHPLGLGLSHLAAQVRLYLGNDHSASCMVTFYSSMFLWHYVLHVY